MKLSGLEFTEAERKAMVDAANQNLTRYEEMRAIHIPNDVSPPFHFSALVPGIEVNRTKLPFRLSAAPAVKRPANLEDVGVLAGAPSRGAAAHAGRSRRSS